jgi:predicted nucleotidyltransferase
MMVPEIVPRITTSLVRAGIAYMISGSFASAYYGAPRSTQDIDIVIDATPDQLRAFIHSLPAEQYYVDLDAALDAHRVKSMFNVIDLTAGWKIDLILHKARHFSVEEFRRPEEVDMDGVQLFVVSAEDAIIAKLEWSKGSHSRRQIEDVTAVIQARRNVLDFAYIEKWTRELGIGAEWNKLRAAANS